LAASHVQKRRTPYHTPGQDLRQLTHSGSPSSTQCLSFSESWCQALSRGMPRFLAYLLRSSWQSLKLLVCQGRTAPSRSVFASSGTTSPKSTPMMRPNPRQVSQAPSGELNENIAGVGSE